MKKSHIIGLIFIAGLLGAIFLMNAGKEPPPVGAGPGRGDEEGRVLYEGAKRLAEEGRLLEARGLYKKLLAEYTRSPLVKDATEELGGLNIRILFSPVETPDCVFYPVRPGDTLYDIAREFRTTVGLIMKSNNLENTVIRPGMKLKISMAKYSILVDKSQNILMLKSNDEVLKTYTVSTGADNSTPSGAHRITDKLIDPTWFKAGAVVPPESPENILGSRWMGLTAAGYGIHGTTDESTIGTQITAGCVRMRNKDVEELYSIVPSGTEVVIID